MKTVRIRLQRPNVSRGFGLGFLTVLLLTILLAGCSSIGSSETTSDAAEAETTATPVPQDEPVADTGDSDVDSDATDKEAPPVASMDPAERNGMYDAPPEMAIDPETYYFATLKTEKGDIKLQLFADRAPETVNNFVYLANQGFYDNTTFHRVLDGFMAQAGDPTGTGTGGPGYQFEDEIVDGLVFDRPGLLAMANAGPGTNGSQFFITFAPTDWLNGLHTIFGEVIEGNEVLNEITRRDPIQDADTPGDLIETIIVEEGGESLLPTPTPLPPTPTPFPPSSMEGADRPLAALEPAERANYFNAEPEMTIDPDSQYLAKIVTSQGAMVAELAADKAPKAVNNFVTLASLGFYDGLPVNQIVPEQVVIVGSPDNDPTHDAGYQFEAEVDLDVVPEKGSIAYIPVQNTPSDPMLSSGSQLLIALTAPPVESNAAFSFFGRITEGSDVLDLLSDVDTIESITIEVVE